jgi:histidine triad (HIT) family protein
MLCEIVDKKRSAKLIHEDGFTITYEDPSPKAPFHFLVIPKKHVESLKALRPDDGPLMGRVILEIARIAHEKRIDETGYRVVTNQGKASGQSTNHVHFHVLGGRTFTWPPG